MTFQKLVFTTDNSADSPGTGDLDTTDLVMEPGNPNNILVAAIGWNAGGGVFRTMNALASTPTFSQTLAIDPGLRSALAINKVGSTVTAYAATSESFSLSTACGPRSGAVRKSIDGGATWSGKLTGGAGFCGGQCFYDLAIAVDQNNANLVYLGGQAHGICADAVKQSANGGTDFTRDDNGLHADTHALFFDGFGNIYTGNDGGVWKRAANATAGSAWTNLNYPQLNSLQFESIAAHPTDRNLMIGGTQDNGTEAQQIAARALPVHRPRRQHDRGQPGVDFQPGIYRLAD